MTLTAPPRTQSIPEYNLAEPTERDAQAALQRVFGAGGADRWAQACQSAQLRPGFVRSGAQLSEVAAALREQGGAAAMVARSIEIRILTFSRLAARIAPTRVTS